MIRRLRAADAPDWRILRLEALERHPEAYGSTHDNWVGEPTTAFAARLEESHVFGAFDADQLVGCLALDLMRGGHVHHRAWITGVYVRDGHRNHGHARAMLTSAERRARHEGVIQLELHVAETNSPARDLYERDGYEFTGISPRALCRNGRFIDEMLMVKRLDA